MAAFIPALKALGKQLLVSKATTEKGTKQQGLLTDATDGLATSFENYTRTFDQQQTQALKFGLSLDKVSSRLEDTVKGLEGADSKRMAAVMESLNAGLQGNTNGVSKLVNQQMLTGTAYGNTAKAFNFLEKTLGLNRKATDDLAESFIKIGGKYEISTDRLVIGMDALKDALPMKQLLGLGGALEEAQAEIFGMLPGQEKFATQLMNLIMDPSIEGMRKRTMLGIEDEAKRFMTAQTSTQERVKLFGEIAAGMTDRGQKFIGNLDDIRTAGLRYNQAVQIFGKELDAAASINASFGKRLTQSAEQITHFGESIQTQMENAWQPLIQLLREEFYPIMLDITKEVMPSVRDAVQDFADLLQTVSKKIGRFFGIGETTDMGAETKRVEAGMGAVQTKVGSLDLPSPSAKLVEATAENMRDDARTILEPTVTRDRIEMTPMLESALGHLEDISTNTRAPLVSPVGRGN
jgi:hypothetical protein